MNQPKKEINLLEEGIGTFVIKWVKSKDKDGSQYLSKSSGKPMISVCCSVKDENGLKQNVYVYFVSHALQMLDKLLDCIGMPMNYPSDVVFNDPDVLLGMEGRCLIERENHDTYGAQNRINFLKKLKDAGPKAYERMEREPEPAYPFDDSIPF